MMILLFIGATLTLDEALASTERTQPAVQQARAEAAAADAREKQARGVLMPQVSLNALYSRTTANFVPRPGAVPTTVDQAALTSFATFDFLNFGATLNQQIYDAHQTIGRYESQIKMSEAADLTAEQRLVDALLSTRTAYFAALAQKGLVAVATDNVASLTKHYEDASAQAEVGRRPQIDVLQAKQQLSTGKLDKIRAENNYRVAKLALNQAMGATADVDYDLAPAPEVVLAEEVMSSDALGELVLSERKDVAALAAQLKAQEWTVVAERGRFFPTLALQLSATGATRTFDNVVWNVGGQVTLSWPIFTGLQELYGMRAAQATAHAINAQRDALVLTAKRAVEEARLTVLATKEAVSAADDALSAAKERMTLADARYETGVGTGLEIVDARLQLTQANSARIQAGLDLAVARARLTAALGRPR